MEVQGSTQKSCIPGLRQYNKVARGTSRYKAWYCLVPWCTFVIQVYRTFGYFLVLSCTLMYSDVSSNGERRNWWTGNQSKCWYIPICTGMYRYIPIHTSTSGFILTGECVYVYIPLYTVTGKYISVHTSSYQLILKHTGTNPCPKPIENVALKSGRPHRFGLV